MLVTTCISSDAARISDAATTSRSPVRFQAKAAPTSTGLIATGRLRGRIAARQAAHDPCRTSATGSFAGGLPGGFIAARLLPGRRPRPEAQARPYTAPMMCDVELAHASRLINHGPTV